MPAARGIDYSKWDHLDDSSDEEEKKKGRQAAVHATVLGFAGRDADQLNGNYTMLPQQNHKRPVFCRLAAGAPPLAAANQKRVDSVLYYWDERDGSHLCGWWFGPAVGADMVWAFNPGDATQPPPAGWREPWFYDISKGARVLLVNASVEVPKHVEEVRVPPVAAALSPAVKRYRSVATPWRCVHCLGWLRSPTVLPCGHVVCRDHAAQQGEAYVCPWSLGCASRRPNFVLGKEGWRAASQLEGLLGPLPPKSAVPPAAPEGGGGATSSTARPTPEAATEEPRDADADPLREAVRSALSPRALVAAYDALGGQRAKAGSAAEAALAYCAARFLHDEFGGAMGLAEMNTAPDCAAPVVQRNKALRAKANCWVKRCGDPITLRVALEQLPLPALEFPPVQAEEWLEADVETFAAGLRETAESEEALQAMAECPVCYGTVFEPVVTPCGHIFCRRCLARTLDCEGDCPLCRGKLAGYIDHYAVCEQLQDLLSALWPEAYSRELRDAAAARRELREGQWLPICEGLLAFPTQPCNLHVFEPGVRLMIRQTLTSGARSFGACVRVAREASGDPEQTTHSQYGTELVIQNVTMLPNGRSLVETMGGRRFRVLESSMQDGYARARVEYLEDQEKASSVEGIPELLEALQGRLPELDQVLAKLREQGLLPSGTSLTQASVSPAAADRVAWAALSMLAMAPFEAKARFLEIGSRAQRFRDLAQLLRDFPIRADPSPPGAATDAAAIVAGGDDGHVAVDATGAGEAAGEPAPAERGGMGAEPAAEQPAAPAA